MIKVKYVIFIYGVLIPILGFSQNLTEDLNTIVTKIENASSISIKVNVKVYSDKNGSLIYSTTSSIDHSDKGTLTKLGEMERLINTNKTIVIDHDEKIVSIQNNQNASQVDLSDVNVKELKNLIENNEDTLNTPIFKLVDVNSGIREYVISNVEGITECKITLDHNKDKILKVTYDYSKDGPYNGQYIVLEYNSMEYNREYADDYFNVNKYYVINNGKYELVNSVKKYSLIVE